VSRHDRPRDQWFEETGPVVRPYALTKGRTSPNGSAAVGLIDVVMATGQWPAESFRPGPEHRQILSACRGPIPFVDLASEVDLPIGVLRVLLSDLVQEGMLSILSTPRGPVTDQRLLRDVLHGLERL
jgi:hypothetical protein